MDIRQWMSILLFMATAMMLFILWLSYRKRHLPVARTMIFTMLAAAFYAFGYGWEVLSRNLAEFKLSLHIEYLGIPFVSTLWFMLVVHFTGIASRHRKRLTAALFVIPVSIFLLFLTNDRHHLIYEEYVLNTETSVPLYTTVKGIGYRVHHLYNYGIMLCGMLMFIPTYWRSSSIVRKQILVLMLGAAVPMVLNLPLWFGSQVDLTPFGFAVSGLFYAWGIYRYNLLRLTPLAHAQVFDTIRDGVVLLDYEDRIVSYNRAARTVLPELESTRRHSAGVGQALSAYPELLDGIRAASAGNDRFSFQRREENRMIYYSCSVTDLYDSGKMPVGKILMFNDITEMKEKEHQLRENARQLSELNAFKDKLFTIVAHDVRDPIALLVSLTELLEEDLAAVGMEHAELFRRLKGHVNHTFHLVDNLLDWYRSQKGTVLFRPLGWNLGQVVRQAMSLAGTKAGIKRIRIAERVDDRIVVSADKEMLDLILRNLLSNAIKYSRVDGWIEIAAAPEGRMVVVSVRDNGVGIDEHTSELLRLEEPFFKPPSEGEDAVNTRFGLVLAREFVRIHGGSLWFESRQGEGTTFYFTLPVFVRGGETIVDGEMED
ncbi:histidine kinase N-terminal 7TM domain-containing protein [Cohnella hongkongensis]|uniref:histidine kinase n=1 Tax=Cohnella hongkongensis TaxID=178337 RepID=A0ABV9FD94_9BACL